MNRCKITVLRISIYQDLSEIYEIPQINPCMMKENMIFYSDGNIPNGFCVEAWKTIEEFVIRLLNGEEKIYGDWMKNPKSVLLSCNDGFRPVSFLIEVEEDD